MNLDRIELKSSYRVKIQIPIGYNPYNHIKYTCDRKWEKDIIIYDRYLSWVKIGYYSVGIKWDDYTFKSQIIILNRLGFKKGPT